MENTETPVQNEEQTTTEPEVVDNIQTTTTEETTDQVVVPETTTTTTEETTTTTPVSEETTAIPVTEETTAVTEEQENVTDTNSTVPPTCLSPGRANVPLKEVNESGNAEPTIVSNGNENGLSKKRELEQEDETTEETTNDNEERNGVDQTKKIKISENTDTPIIETKEIENNLVVNGNNTAVEV